MSQYSQQINQQIKMIFFWEQANSCLKNLLQQLVITCQCPVESIFAVLSPNVQSNMEKIKGQKKLILQLRERYVTVISQETSEIIDFFECQPEISFLIREVNECNNKEINGEDKSKEHYLYIRFAKEGSVQKTTTFIINKNHKNCIEQFGIFLGKQFIKQLGFQQKFKPVRVLGKGLTATVYAAKRFSDQSTIAIKAFKKSTFYPKQNGKGKKAIEKQFKILTECCHQNICNFHGIFESENTIYLTMQSYHKSLMNALSSPFSRSETIQMMEQLLKGVNYLHSKRIMHRDIKLQNIMLQKTITGFRPVIIDFGMAEYIDQETYLFNKCGTPGYAAPEMFAEKADFPERCDIFSLGVIFYIMLLKKPIFMGSTASEVLQNNKSGNMVLDMISLNNEDPLVKDLLLKMLQRQNSLRISAQEALSHNLFNPESQLTPALSTSSTCVAVGFLNLNSEI